MKYKTAWEARKEQSWWATNNLCSPEKRKKLDTREFLKSEELINQIIRPLKYLSR